MTSTTILKRTNTPAPPPPATASRYRAAKAVALAGSASAAPRLLPSVPQLIPLNRLRRADENVRHTRSDEAVSEIAASIRAHGLLQSLIGYEANIGGYGEPRVMIVGGGRRLMALAILEDEELLDGDWPVPVLIRDKDDALELSLAENLEHQNMSPVDEFFAFRGLIATGRYDAAELAKRFGFTEKLVKQRLRLAELDSEVLDALSERQITLDAAMAYATSQDRALQREVFRQNNKPNTYDAHKPDKIKRDLRAAGMDTSHRLYKFVGASAYEAAGGGYEDTLFQAEAQERQLDKPHLLEQLAHDRLDSQEAALVREFAGRDDLAPTVEGVVRIPGLVLHSPHYLSGKAPTAPAGFAAVTKDSHSSSKAWKTVRNNNLPVQVAVGIDGDGKVQAYTHTLFVPKMQRDAIDPPRGELKLQQMETPEQAAARLRQRDVDRLARRLAVPAFAGTPFEGKVYWPDSWRDNSRPATQNGEQGWLVTAEIFVTDAAIAAQGGAAAVEYDRQQAAKAEVSA